MEMREVMIEIPANAAIICLKCYDGNGTFFAESMSIVDGEEEVAEEEEKEEEVKEEESE